MPLNFRFSPKQENAFAGGWLRPSYRRISISGTIVTLESETSFSYQTHLTPEATGKIRSVLNLPNQIRKDAKNRALGEPLDSKWHIQSILSEERSRTGIIKTDMAMSTTGGLLS